MGSFKSEGDEISSDLVDELTHRTLNPNLDDDSRLQALKGLRNMRSPDGSVPDKAFEALLEVIWDYLGDRHSDFQSEGEELKSTFREWKNDLTPKQVGFVLGIHHCMRRGSFVVFRACLEGNAGSRDERLIDEAKWHDFRSVIEEYEARWHAQDLQPR